MVIIFTVCTLFGGLYGLYYCSKHSLQLTITGHQKTKNSALDILQKRFAVGQTSKEQYLKHKALLEKDIN